MSIVKISELPAATSPVSPSDVTAVVQGNVTKKAAIDQLGFIAAGTGANPRTIQNKLRETVSVKDFGAVGDGVANDQAACQAAIDYVQSAGGGVVLFPEGSYLIGGVTSPDSVLNGLKVPFVSVNGTDNRVILQGKGRSTVLLAGNNNMYVVRFSDSHGGVRDLTIDGNGKTDVVGLGCVPDDTTQTTTLVWQNHNIFSGLYILNCAEGYVLKAGPDVGGADSGCWYNTLKETHIYFCLRGIWLREGPNASCSGANRNNFMNIRIGSNCNTGVQIDSGDTCKFYAVNFEGINDFTSPNATPTAIKIAQAGTLSGLDNNNNMFFGSTIESCTRDLDNFNPRSQFYGVKLANNKVNTTGGAVYGFITIGGEDPSQTPQIYGGGVYQANSQIPGVINGTTFNTLSGSATISTTGVYSSTNGFQTTTSFQETSGSSGNIAGGATFVITVPTMRRPQVLFLYSSTNYNQPGIYYFCGDGVVNPTVASVVSSAIISVTGTAANQLTVTNDSVNATVIRWTLTPFGVAG